MKKVYIIIAIVLIACFVGIAFLLLILFLSIGGTGSALGGENWQENSGVARGY